MNELPDDEYRCMVQTLNKEQKEFFYHVLHLIKTSGEAFYCFLSGGAGVGKSHVTKALYQAALKYYNTRPGVNFAETKILMLAPTGKAAYNIKGNTIHSALAVPACQSLKNYKKLDSSRLNTLRCQIGGLKLIFVDEISMVGNTMFNVQFNNRLKDIKGSSLPFGGVSIVAIGDLFQLQPVMDGYIFKDMDNDEYGVLAPNVWQELFKMFELKEIMRQRGESKDFAELLNRLREGNHTKEGIIKLKERILNHTSAQYPKDAPHLFIQNAKVNDFNYKAHNALQGPKYSIKAHDTVIGTDSEELRDKILKQIPKDPRKTKQLHSVLHLAIGERTEISLNTRNDDGMTNGAGSVIKFMQIHKTDKPSGIIWVQFDHADVGQKTRHDNRQLYVNDIEPTWTPIKPSSTQFAVGRTRSVHVMRKQFPLRPAAAKTIHRSQGDTESRIVVNFETKRAIPHIHYVGLSRVTTIDGLYITDLCESKIAVNTDVQTEMHRLRTEGKLSLSVSPIYEAPQASIKICFLNARSLHKHIDDIRHDLNYSSTDVNIFSETRFFQHENDDSYLLDDKNYTLFRNDGTPRQNVRPYGGTAVYSRLDYYPGYPFCKYTWCRNNYFEVYDHTSYYNSGSIQLTNSINNRIM
ncbi:ATP-dependent DNA helicase PIF1 isoform X1 [Nematostella vectensis]|uniref:ATP-dependent DNA helicase PIF1 isoform X1 n=1 Tax=Nematostella vectensis TaxID=45351 RepID=UPI002076ED77|nr:ATP-dependent DNA helicase PIF1 isoform X1 [Nematostella vectensis]